MKRPFTGTHVDGTINSGLGNPPQTVDLKPFLQLGRVNISDRPKTEIAVILFPIQGSRENWAAEHLIISENVLNRRIIAHRDKSVCEIGNRLFAVALAPVEPF